MHNNNNNKRTKVSQEHREEARGQWRCVSNGWRKPRDILAPSRSRRYETTPLRKLHLKPRPLAPSLSNTVNMPDLQKPLPLSPSVSLIGPSPSYTSFANVIFISLHRCYFRFPSPHPFSLPYKYASKVHVHIVGKKITASFINISIASYHQDLEIHYSPLLIPRPRPYEPLLRPCRGVRPDSSGKNNGSKQESIFVVSN